MDIEVTKETQKTLRLIDCYELTLPITSRFYPFENDFSVFIGLRATYALYLPRKNSKEETQNHSGEKIKKEDEPVNLYDDYSKVIIPRIDLTWGIEYENRLGIILGLQHTLWLTDTLKKYHPSYPTQQLNQIQVAKFIPSLLIGCDWIRIANRIHESDLEKITNSKFGLSIDYNLGRPNIGIFYEYLLTSYFGIHFGAEYSYDNFFASFFNIKGKPTAVEFRNTLFNYGRRPTLYGEMQMDTRSSIGSLHFEIHSLSIPMIARLYPLKNDFCIYGGLQVDYIIKIFCHRSYDEKINDPSKNLYESKNETINPFKKMSNGEPFTNRIRLCFICGIDWETGFGLIYGVRNTVWLTKIVNANPDYLPYKDISYNPGSGESYKIGITLGVNIATIINLFVRDSNSDQNI